MGSQDFSQASDLDAIETAFRSALMRLGGGILQSYLNADNSDCQGPHLRCGCGGTARYAGRFPKNFVTLLDRMRLWRAYYHCDTCSSGWYPKDQALGLTERSVSPGLVRLTGLSSAHVSFAEAAGLLRDLAGVIVSVKQVERTAQSLGADIAEDERNRIDPEPNRTATMYLGIDGTGVPTRKSETAGRAGKQPDGSAKTREMKLAVVWTADTTDDEGRIRADAMSASYSAAIESARTGDRDRELSAFAQRVDREAARRGFHDVERQVVIGDGALWIWNLCDELFPRAIQIVDIWHAKERVWDVAKSVYGTGTDLSKQWATTQVALLRAGDIEALLEAMSDHRATDDEADRAYNYFSRNRERMRYRTFRDDGLCVSSGMVEGGCKNIIGARLKRGGMHWTVRGANKIAALRSCILSNRFEDYWYEKSVNR